MRDRILVAHFLNQFVETEFSPDADRHQTLAIAAAALVTIPLFVTVFMSVKYLMRPLQASGWTETTVVGDLVTFCAVSMLVTAAVTLLEWDALGLSPRDAAILGVLPVPHRVIVRAKLIALLTFASAFAVALNAIPALLHPLLMTAQLPMSPIMLLPLAAAHGFSTIMAAAFGFCAVLSVRESLYAVLGPSRFHRLSNGIRSLLLFAVLMLLALVPVRLSDSAPWMLAPSSGNILLEPVRWFAGEHAALAGRMLDSLPRPDLPTRLAIEERRLSTTYREALPRLTTAAFEGAGAVAVTFALSIGLYLWNARRMHLLAEGPPPRAISRFGRGAAVTVLHPARRAGLLFAARALVRSPVHRVYMIVALVTGIALFIALGGGPLRTKTLAAQTLLVAAVVSGFRAAIRTAADYRAAWIFDTAETDCGDRFRDGVRLAGIGLMVTTVALLLPSGAATWSWPTAFAHAAGGLAIGWLLVEGAMIDVERPLVVSIPPSDGMNTVGVVLGGAAVIAIFITAHIERFTLMTTTGRVVFPLVFAAIAFAIRIRHSALSIRH